MVIPGRCLENLRTDNLLITTLKYSDKHFGFLIYSVSHVWKPSWNSKSILTSWTRGHNTQGLASNAFLVSGFPVQFLSMCRKLKFKEEP